MPPLVSVVIPVYNRTEVLPQTLNSVRAQTHQNFEVFVVDDGSTEDIESVVKSLHDSRIDYIRLSEHTNANVARNVGIRAAQGEYIAMLDSDDEWLPHHLERRLQKIIEWDCDGIHGSFFIDDGATRQPAIARSRRQSESIPDYVLSGNWAQTSSHFYRREAVKETIWDESLARHQDYDYTIRFATRFKFLCDPEPTVIVHWKKSAARTFNFESRARFYEKYKNQLSPSVAVEYLHSQMHQAVSFGEPPITLAYYTSQLRSFRSVLSARFEFFLSQHPYIYFWWRNHPACHKFILLLRQLLSHRQGRRPA